MRKSRGNPGSTTVQVRICGQPWEHLRLACHVLQVSKPELLRRAWDEYFAKLRRQFEIPKGGTLEQYLAERQVSPEGPE